MKRSIVRAIVVFVLCIAASAFGSGMLIPRDQSLPPLAIKSQRVNIQIKDGTATASIEQVFKNNVDRDLEAVYVFPLPENASIADFAMYINGKRVSGELVEKGKARQIYEDIVRRMKDPGLLEQMGGNLFRVSVYPVPRNGEQRIEISYSQTLEFEAGLYKYVYPLKTSERASSTLGDFTVKAEIASGVPIKTVYSPSHKIGVTRKGDNRAVIGFEEERALLDRDFVLYYGVSKKDFGINLITHAVQGQDGYFMMLLAPTVAPKAEQVVRRDVSFVFDTSGSMMGDEIKQAREALKYCIRKLNDGDRFNIVRFSTDVEKLSVEFMDVNEKNLKKADEFIATIEARGGTAIDEAMNAALGAAKKGDRPHLVVFLTDGKPTIGETDPKVILENIRKHSGTRSRIFVFGVGEDLNAHLLDGMSSENGGVSQYVAPGEDIEVKVSSFADKINTPVLAQPKLTIDKLDVKMIHPQELADLFAGQQITIFGRYKGNGDYAIRLAGEINGKKQEFVFEGTFPKENSENEFIPRLWATRRVGYLLDEIRLRGEDKELKDEVIRLGKEHGIMTPYTSYLVLESDDAYRQNGIDRLKNEGTGYAAKKPAPPASGWTWTEKTERGSAMDGRSSRGGSDLAAAAPAVQAVTPAESAPMPVFARNFAEESALSGSSSHVGGRKEMSRASETELKRQFEGQAGKDAVKLSKAIEDYKKADSVNDDIAPMVKQVGRKIFYLANGVWTDRDYKTGMKTVTVKYGSDEYFKLVSDKPELKKFLALGQKVIVCIDDKTAVIVE
ncbi:MAG: VIT domain-containing protein [bacterium]